MPRSRTLPAELDPSARQLVARLRLLKDHSELTMRQLAVKTGYSAKSWERYLGGTSLPPREAVEALAGITGTDPVPLLALHEIAIDSRDDRRARPAAQRQNEQREREGEQSTSTTTPHPGPPAAATARMPPRATGPAPGRFPHLALTAGIAALVVALSAALLLMVRLDDEAGRAAVTASPRATVTSPPPSYTCRISRLDGRWSAGINKGRDTEIVYGATGADVAEAQCLLRRAGISPGGIDGMFGPLTLRAVKTFQERAGLTVDGMLGPRSWKALRG
ncbi:peptidoglycan-binding protein [Streptomyces canus]|uniref:Peptidoglycan-binding protein n=1 Tax=Streptomyces canus TaxID=58343 RepID=A0A101RRH7_9ACTN|nr:MULTISPECIES: peptidoglycan-binding protein [Streptomyces]KUN60440.1 peptidoglycan-binding protein [Streptomyces canus]MDI5907957.1 peptidoglycan-binding protein [Streptomyces sp. 12257]